MGVSWICARYGYVVNEMLILFACSFLCKTALHGSRLYVYDSVTSFSETIIAYRVLHSVFHVISYTLKYLCPDWTTEIQRKVTSRPPLFLLCEPNSSAIFGFLLHACMFLGTKYGRTRDN